MIRRRGVIGAFIACVGCATMACDNSKVVAPAMGEDTLVVTRTDILVEDPVLEGTIRSDAGVDFLYTLFAGSNPYTTGLYRAFFGFELAPIPTGSAVTNAQLSITLCAMSATPFDSLGPLIAEHVDYGNGTMLDSYSMAPLEATQYVVATAGPLATHTVDVTSAVASDMAAGRPHSEFRLRFANHDGDSVNDGVAIVGTVNQSCDGGLNGVTPVGSKPQLTVTSHTERVLAAP